LGSVDKFSHGEKLKQQVSMSNTMNGTDAAIVFGGLVVVAGAGMLFLLFPMYQLLDTTSVRKPIWNPPAIVIREPGQGLKPEDIARLDKDPRQKELLKGIKDGITYQPSPSWLGYPKTDVNKPIRVGRRFPTNGLLYVFVASVAGYVFALRQRGIV
jgi:hypothetical protein